MHTDIYRDTMYPIELFGKNALYTEGTVAREEVPDGWYRYDLCGTEQKPDKPLKLTDTALEFRTGMVLSPVPLKRITTLERKVNGQLFAEGRPITLAQFCEEQNLPCPQDPRKYVLRPASPTEAGFFYAQTPEEDEKQGAIGHVRIDFGYEGKEFWHTWWPRGPEELNTPEFKAELGQVVGELRQSVLKDLSSIDTPSTNVVIGQGGDTQTVVVKNTKKGALIVEKYDSVTKQPLSGAQFKITTASGELVADNEGLTSSKGLYRTDKNGEIRIFGITGTLIIQETETIPGYVLNKYSRRVKVNANDVQTVTFYNAPWAAWSSSRWMPRTSPSV